MGKVYRFLGLTVGLIIHDMDKPARQRAYAADITYGTNNEMGFDYLRDNMALYAGELVQRGHHFAIVASGRMSSRVSPLARRSLNSVVLAVSWGSSTAASGWARSSAFWASPWV